jgi:hypothetical protein
LGSASILMLSLFLLSYRTPLKSLREYYITIMFFCIPTMYCASYQSLQFSAISIIISLSNPKLRFRSSAISPRYTLQYHKNASSVKSNPFPCPRYIAFMHRTPGHTERIGPRYFDHCREQHTGSDSTILRPGLSESRAHGPSSSSKAYNADIRCCTASSYITRCVAFAIKSSRPERHHRD